MTIKHVLILIPVILILFLVQSYWWVPTYEEQTRGNPERLSEYITASLGDATVLNPILSANSTSAQIESLVFEGLLDRDEELHLRGRLAASWDLLEEAYFYVHAEASVPGHGKLEPAGLVDLLNQAREEAAGKDGPLAASLRRIREISVIPPQASQTRIQRKVQEEGGEREEEVVVHVDSPARIKLVLHEVDQDLFENLEEILGPDYFSSFPGTRFVRTEPALDAETLDRYAGERIPATEHNPVLIFHLRPGVRFHDGHPFTARDVKFTYEAIMNPANLSPRIADYEPVKTVEVVDPLSVRIVYKRLYSPAVSTWGIGMLPEHLLNDEALQREARALGRDPEGFSIRQSRFNRHPIGCGPFVFEEWKSAQYIQLKRFEDYWEGPPHYKRYALRIIPDLLTQEMEFYAGTLDNYTVQPHQAARLEKDPRFQSFSGTSFGYTYIGYNLRRPPFDDVRVRTALGMALHVEDIIEYVLYGQGERITGPFVKQTEYYNHGIPPLPYDPEGALRLLAEAGWHPNAQGWLEKEGKPLQFTLITTSGNEIRRSILAIAQEAWKQIGIDVRTDVLEWSVFIQERVDKGDFDALILGWVMGIEPDLFQIWHSSQVHPYQLNFVGFQNAEADDLILKIRKEYDFEKQAAYCHRLHEIIAREQPYTFLFVSRWTAILDRRIVIQELDEEGLMLYRRIEPTKTGNYTFHFNRWIKVPELPVLSSEE